MILDFFVLNFLEELYIYVAIACLMNRKQLLIKNPQRVLIGIITVFVTAGLVFALRRIPGMPSMQLRMLILLIAFSIAYMISLRINWLQSLVGVFALLVTIIIIDGFSIIFYKLANISFEEKSVNVNFQTLPTIISSRLLFIVIIFIIVKMGITIRIPDKFKIENSVYKMIIYLFLLSYLVFVSLREVIMGAEEIRVGYLASVAIAGAILGGIIIKYVRMEALQIKELRKTRNKIKTGEIYDDIIDKKYINS